MTTDWERFCKDGIFTIFVNSMVSHYYSLKFPFCHHYPMQILGNPSRRFSMNLRTVNVIPVIVNTGVIVPLISLMTNRYRKVRPRNIPCRRKIKIKKRTAESHQDRKIMANANSWWRCFCFFTGTEESNWPKNNHRVTAIFSTMPCITYL